MSFLFTSYYTLWIATQDFAKWQTSLYWWNWPVVSFISIAYVVVKLKIFKVSCIDSASIKWPFFGFFDPYSPMFDLAEILTTGKPIRQTHCLKNLSKFWNLFQMESLRGGGGRGARSTPVWGIKAPFQFHTPVHNKVRLLRITLKKFRPSKHFVNCFLGDVKVEILLISCHF